MPRNRPAQVSRRRFLRNRAVRRSLRTYRTRAARALATGTPEEALEGVREAMSAMDRAARKGVIHRNRAARLKSRLARRLNASLPAAA